MSSIITTDEYWDAVSSALGLDELNMFNFEIVGGDVGQPMSLHINAYLSTDQLIEIGRKLEELSADEHPAVSH